MIKCNSCMQTLESKSLENHIKKYHFEKTEKYLISEKNLSHTLDTSSISTISNLFRLVTRINNQFCKILKHFKEKFFVQKRLHSSSKLFKRTSHNHPLVKHAKLQSTVKLVCNSCKKEIDSEIGRILITRNIDKNPQFFSFHFFPPCWSFGDFCQKHPNLTLDRITFNIPENNSMSENGIKDLQSNLTFWD